jgi:putrescine transport system substrate-binding protein
MRIGCSSTLCLLLTSAVCHAADVPAPAIDRENALNIYNWADYIDPDVLEDFARETGIIVTYEMMDSNQLLETKLVAGRTGYDVVFPSASFLDRQIKAGIYRKLDKPRLPNLRNLDPDITGKLGNFDPGNEYSAIYMWGTSGVAYNDATLKAVMPDAPVNSFAMFYDPRVVSRFAECGVSVLDAPSEVIATVLLYLGKDANSELPEDLAAAEAVLMSIRPYIRTINSSSYIEDLASGEICLALGWSGDVLQAQARTEEAGKPFRIEYRLPREGAVMFFDSMAIPADAEHVQNAHLFINYMLRAEVAAANSRFVGFPNGNLASKPRIPMELMADKDFFPPPEVQKKLVPDLPESARYIKQLSRTWTRFRAGQ